jgi:hypothetical protein
VLYPYIEAVRRELRGGALVAAVRTALGA